MAEIKIDAEVLKRRIEELKKEFKDLVDERCFYGESGFRNTRLTDDLLVRARQKEAQIKEYEALLKEAQK